MVITFAFSALMHMLVVLIWSTPPHPPFLGALQAAFDRIPSTRLHYAYAVAGSPTGTEGEESRITRAQHTVGGEAGALRGFRFRVYGLGQGLRV